MLKFFILKFMALELLKTFFLKTKTLFLTSDHFNIEKLYDWPNLELWQFFYSS